MKISVMSTLIHIIIKRQIITSKYTDTDILNFSM